jgi:hypothetical protein
MGLIDDLIDNLDVGCSCLLIVIILGTVLLLFILTAAIIYLVLKVASAI